MGIGRVVGWLLGQSCAILKLLCMGRMCTQWLLSFETTRVWGQAEQLRGLALFGELPVLG